MISLLVNFYAQDPGPAIESALRWVPSIDNVCTLDGRYQGFEPIAGFEDAPVFASEHAKRDALLRLADETAPGGPCHERWILILDCDELITYASPQLPMQLEMHLDDVAGCRAIEPLPPLGHPMGNLLAGLGKPGRSIRDNVYLMPRLIRHRPGLQYRHRHDFLVAGDGRQLLGWDTEGIRPAQPVDLDYVHLWWTIPDERRDAKAFFYASKDRMAENVAWGAPVEPEKPVDPDLGWLDESPFESPSFETVEKRHPRPLGAER